MIDVDKYNIKTMLKLGLIHVNMVYPIRKNAHFRVERPISIQLSDLTKINIPKNYEFDGSSSPRFLWWLFPSYGNFFFAALIHDYLYTTQAKTEEIGFRAAQKFADKEMLLWSNILNNNKIDNYFRYFAVRIFGKRKYLT